MNKINEKFGCLSARFIYMPAGRGTAYMLENLLPSYVQYPPNTFLNEILKIVSRNRDLKPMQEIIDLPIHISEIKCKKEIALIAIEMVRSVLKGDFETKSEKDVLRISENVVIPVDLISSGQQELLMMLLPLLSCILYSSKPQFFIIEEPEAHLYSDAQKAIMEFIAFTANVTGSRFLITTHSPYMLEALNNLIYASKVGEASESKGEKVKEVIPKDIWMKPENVTAYLVKDGGVESIIDEDGEIDSDKLDTASDLIAEQFDKLLVIARED